jgi:hypothetical protein
MSKQRGNSSKKSLIWLVAAILMLAGGAYAYQMTQDDNQVKTSPQSAVKQSLVMPVFSIDYSKVPTEWVVERDQSDIVLLSVGSGIGQEGPKERCFVQGVLLEDIEIDPSVSLTDQLFDSTAKTVKDNKGYESERFADTTLDLVTPDGSTKSIVAYQAKAYFADGTNTSYKTVAAFYKGDKLYSLEMSCDEQADLEIAKRALRSVKVGI